MSTSSDYWLCSSFVMPGQFHLGWISEHFIRTGGLMSSHDNVIINRDYEDHLSRNVAASQSPQAQR